MVSFDYAYWGIWKNKLDAIDKWMNHMGEEYHLTDADFDIIEEDAVAIANKIMANWKGLAVKEITKVICGARIKSTLDYIEKMHDVAFREYEIDMDGIGIRVICKGEEL